MACPQCQKSKLRIRLAKTNGNLFVACSGYPECKNTLPMPKGISNVHMLADKKCQRCWKRDRKEVLTFKVEFDPNVVNEVMTEVLPYDDNTAGEFCVFLGCDSQFKRLHDETMFLPTRRTFDEAFQASKNGVPNYYYQKPEV